MADVSEWVADSDVSDAALVPVAVEAQPEMASAPAATVSPEASAEGETPEQADAREARDDKGRFKSRYEARKVKLQAEIDDLVRQRESLRRETAAPSAPSAPSAPRPAAAAPASTGDEPKLDAFLAEGKTYEDWVDARADWRVDQRLTRERHTQAQQSAERAFTSRIDAFRAEHPDYDEIVGTADVQVSQPMADVIRHEDFGPRLVYHLAQHPDVAARLAQLSPGKVLIEMGRLAAQLETPQSTTASSPRAIPPSKAPAPVAPVGEGAIASIDPADLDTDDFIRVENAKLRERGRR